MSSVLFHWRDREKKAWGDMGGWRGEGESIWFGE